VLSVSERSDLVAATIYTTQLQAGLGLIEETRELLDLWQEGMSTTELNHMALSSGRFPNVSARRLRNIVSECFAPRYLVPPGPPAIYLKQLVSNVTTQELLQLLLIYTARANTIFADFIRDVYWQRYSSGLDYIDKEHARQFILQAIDEGKTSKRWSDTTLNRVSGYLLGCCADYGLLGQRVKGGRLVAPFRIETRVAAYLAHELHFSDRGDNAVVAHEDWGLFGLEASDVRNELKRVSLQGHIIVQTAGNVIQIGWRYESLRELVDVLAQH
jgi:BrxA